MYAVKRFPPELQVKLDTYKVKYATFDTEHYGEGIDFQGNEFSKRFARKIKRKAGVEIYDEKLRHHYFTTEHMTVGINIKFMDEPRFD